MDVRDVVKTYYDLMLKMINNEMKNGEIFNVSSDQPHEIGYYLDMMLELFHRNDIKKEINPKLIRAIDLPIQQPDCTKIKDFINWKLTIPIEKSLKDLVDYWIEHEGEYK